jgi:hypothetical protein
MMLTVLVFTVKTKITINMHLFMIEHGSQKKSMRMVLVGRNYIFLNQSRKIKDVKTVKM